MRRDKDVGSSEYQIARISTRIKQLTEHLKEHKTDHATRRGLMALLNKRNKLLQVNKCFEKFALLLFPLILFIC